MYYIIYDLSDNIICYIKDLDELADYTNCRKKQLKYKLKDKDYIYYQYGGTYRKIYKFCK